MNVEKIKENLSAISRCISLTIVDPTNGHELVAILNDCMAMQALSSDCVARAEVELTRQISLVIESGKYDKYSATDRKHLIQRDCGDMVELFNKAERYNKELHYRIEGLRTLISNAKELLKQHI